MKILFTCFFLYVFFSLPICCCLRYHANTFVRTLFCPEVLETSFPLTSGKILDVARMWLGCGSDVARMWFGCGSGVARAWLGRGSDVARVSLGRVSRCGSKSLAEVKGKKVSSVRKSQIRCHVVMPAETPHSGIGN